MGYDQLAPKWRTCQRCGRELRITGNRGARWVEADSYVVVPAGDRRLKPWLTVIRSDVHEIACSKAAGVPVEHV